jgi:hypothetical protein
MKITFTFSDYHSTFTGIIIENKMITFVKNGKDHNSYGPARFFRDENFYWLDGLIVSRCSSTNEKFDTLTRKLRDIYVNAERKQLLNGE